MEALTPHEREIMRLWGVLRQHEEREMARPKDKTAVPEEALWGFPEGHPAREQAEFTQAQAFAYPVLLWFFDAERSRGTGRTYLMAKVLIELAMRGEKVKVEDLSAPEGFRSRVNHFRGVVLDLIAKDYPKHLFHYRQTDNTLTYEGRRP